MRVLILSLVSAALVLSGDLGASAQRAPMKVVGRGQTLKVDYFYSIDPQCHVLAVPTINVLAAPQTGLVLTGIGQDFPSFASTNVRFHCDRHRVRSAEVFYNAARDVIGSGLLSLEVIFANGSAKRYDYTIDIR